MLDLVSTGGAAGILDVSRERVLQLVREGRLRVAARDGFGRRRRRRSDGRPGCLGIEVAGT